jgi:hypothetical protein
MNTLQIVLAVAFALGIVVCFVVLWRRSRPGRRGQR